jgi:uncharacterized protein (TIGR03437 family)
MKVAPNELVSFAVLGASASRGIAELSPQLPVELDGYSITIEDVRQGLSPTRLPIVRMDGAGCGSTWATGTTCKVFAITVQIPQDLALTTNVGVTAPAKPSFSVWKDGVQGPLTQFQAVSSNPTILTSLTHVSRSPEAPCPDSFDSDKSTTHEDGSCVDRSNPARPGEVIVIRALGLGATAPMVPSGEPAPAPPARTLLPFVARMQAFVGTVLSPVGESTVRDVESSVLRTGLVGVYEVRVRIPAELTTEMPDCSSGGNLMVQIYQKARNIEPPRVNTSEWSRSYAMVCVQPLE